MTKKTVIIIASSPPECYGNFKKLCLAKGWVYQTLSNAGKIPKIGGPVNLHGFEIHRVVKM